ncbi:hypothetical protein MBLNU457_4721t1 [Dothideomycetes sp. NU457]
MLNVRALNGLLTENTDARLFPRWFIITPNGTLIAHSTPTNIRSLRDQIALISITWKEQVAERLSHQNNNTTSPDHASLETLTLEFDRRTVIVRHLQAKILLVLEGGAPPGYTEVKVTAEGPGDPRYPALTDGMNGVVNGNGSAYGSPSQASGSTAVSVGRRAKVLDLQRRKMDALARLIKENLESSVFGMPEEGGDKFF